MPPELKPPNSLRVSTCTDFGALCRLEAEGHKLWLRYPQATPFQSPYWQLPFDIGDQLMAHALAQARRTGARSFDFLRGCEPYKYRWRACDQPTFSRRLYRDPASRHDPSNTFQSRVESPDSAPSVA